MLVRADSASSQLLRVKIGRAAVKRIVGPRERAGNSRQPACQAALGNLAYGRPGSSLFSSHCVEPDCEPAHPAGRRPTLVGIRLLFFFPPGDCLCRTGSWKYSKRANCFRSACLRQPMRLPMLRLTRESSSTRRPPLPAERFTVPTTRTATTTILAGTR